ncbi:hypothetical protein D3C72_2165300 [compost metagenome]
MYLSDPLHHVVYRGRVEGETVWLSLLARSPELLKFPHDLVAVGCSELMVMASDYSRLRIIR